MVLCIAAISTCVQTIQMGVNSNNTTSVIRIILLMPFENAHQLTWWRFASFTCSHSISFWFQFLIKNPNRTKRSNATNEDYPWTMLMMTTTATTTTSITKNGINNTTNTVLFRIYVFISIFQIKKKVQNKIRKYRTKWTKAFLHSESVLSK